MTHKQTILLVAAVMFVSVLSACSGDKKETPVSRETVSNLGVVAAQKISAHDYIENTGTVRARESAQLSSQVLAAVIGVNVHEGDQVRRGQVLVTLDDSQFRAGTERASAAVMAADKESSAADANYNLAAATVKRYENLFSKQSVSPQEFDEVKARYQAAQAQLEQAHAGQAQARAGLAEAKTMQGYTRLIAPFDGVITDKRVDLGNLAAPGTPLLSVESTGGYRLEANVNEKDIGLIRIGMMAPVKIESLSAEPISARVVQIVPAADPASRSFVVKLDLPNLANLRSGLFGRVSIPKGSREMLLVPRSAVLDRGQLQAVYVIGNDQVAALRYVTLGHEQEKNIEVLSGIEPGEKLVANPGQRDLSGKLVRQ